MEEFECEVCGSLVFVSPDQAKVVCQNCLSEYCKEGLNPGEAVTHLESSVVRSFEVVPAPFTVWDQTFDPPPEATHVLALRTLVPMPWWLLGPAIDADRSREATTSSNPLGIDNRRTRRHSRDGSNHPLPEEVSRWRGKELRLLTR